MTSMNSSRPYLVTAIHDWIVDNNCTPYILVDALHPQAVVPNEYVQDGRIVLNISPSAVMNLNIGSEALEFGGRFSGVARSLYVPMDALLGIYARENGQGMLFNGNEPVISAGTSSGAQSEYSADDLALDAETAKTSPAKPSASSNKVRLSSVGGGSDSKIATSKKTGNLKSAGAGAKPAGGAEGSGTANPDSAKKDPSKEPTPPNGKPPKGTSPGGGKQGSRPSLKVVK